MTDERTNGPESERPADSPLAGSLDPGAVDPNVADPGGLDSGSVGRTRVAAGASGRPSRRPWWRIALVVALLAYFGWASIWIVEQNERGVRTRFGRVVQTVPAGIAFTLPWPIENVQTLQTTEVRTMPIGYRAIDRAKGLGPRDEEVQWLTGDTNIVEIEGTVTYTIASPSDYLFAVGDSSDGGGRAFVIRKVSEAVMSSLVARMTIDDVLATGKAELQREASGEAQALLDEIGLGVVLNSFNITRVQPPMSVIGTFTDVASARADRERTITEALGEAERIKPRARAEANETLQEARIYANSLVTAAKGASASFAKLAENARSEPEIIRARLWLETLKRVLPRVETIVVPPGSGEAPARVVLRR